MKIIKPGMDTKDVVARFDAERQTLAIMDHPNIAKVFDAGATETGRPYFVMELVRGVPLTEYADHNHLSTSERLELFNEVCRAVHHAHQKGVIHRDLKPSNVLVTLHDGKACPKVIDFGVAKAINQPMTEQTMFTNYGQVIGTPQYMSPEQAELSGLDIDIRSDIYSLGVILYELLTGQTPFSAEEIRRAGFDEMRRMIREQEPPRPSNVIQTFDAETATSVASHRSSKPDTLSKLFRGELDWIVMKTLEKDRTRRYESAVGLADDVERHLRDESVQARPPSLGYRFWKTYRKHRVACISGLAIAASLLIALGGLAFALRESNASADSIRRSQQQTELARVEAEELAEKLARESRTAEQTLDILLDVLSKSHTNPETGQPFTVREALSALAGEPEPTDAKSGTRKLVLPSKIAVTLNLALGKAFQENLEFDVAANHFEAARKHFLKSKAGDSRVHAEILRELGYAALDTSRLKQAIELAKRNNLSTEYMAGLTFLGEVYEHTRKAIELCFKNRSGEPIIRSVVVTLLALNVVHEPTAQWVQSIEERLSQAFEQGDEISQIDGQLLRAIKIACGDVAVADEILKQFPTMKLLEAGLIQKQLASLGRLNESISFNQELLRLHKENGNLTMGGTFCIKRETSMSWVTMTPPKNCFVKVVTCCGRVPTSVGLGRVTCCFGQFL